MTDTQDEDMTFQDLIMPAHYGYHNGAIWAGIQEQVNLLGGNFQVTSAPIGAQRYWSNYHSERR